jgi:hypothetical protein
MVFLLNGQEQEVIFDLVVSKEMFRLFLSVF